jgi:hypothetical protein
VLFTKTSGHGGSQHCKVVCTLRAFKLPVNQQAQLTRLPLETNLILCSSSSSEANLPLGNRH